MGRGRLTGIGDEARAVIERRQPRHAPNPAEHEASVLHWLNNRDKHRLLHTFAAFPIPAKIYFDPELPGPNEGGVVPPPYEDGTQVFWCRTAHCCPAT